MNVSRLSKPMLVVALFTAAAASGAVDDERLLSGLRARRLFQLAETHCVSRLAEQDLPPGESANLTVELIRVYAEVAMNSPTETRQASWDKARATAEAFAADHADAPRAILVRVQDALTMLAQGELSRMESEVNSNRDEALAAAREVSRQASSSFHAIDRELTQLVPQQNRRLQPGDLSPQELASLQHNVRFHLARAHRNQALCFPSGSSDRTASLTEALEQLKQPLLQLAPDDPLATEARLNQIVGLRLLGDFNAAAQYLRSFAAIELPAEKQLLVRAEAIRFHVARGKEQDALQVIARGRRIAGVAAPELDFSFLEAYASLWKASADAKDDDERDAWRKKSIATAKFIEQTHGTYWGRRAELLLVRIGQGSGDGSLEILRRTADDLYRKRRFSDAIAAYDKAVKAASAGGDQQHAFEFAYKAALVQQEQKLSEEAGQRFRQLALSSKMHPHAANAHLLAIVNVRQASVAAREWMPGYADLLREHLKQWPSSTKTVDTVAFWLGEFVSQEGKWAAAVDAYRQVSPAARSYAQAMKSLGVCWQQKLGVMLRASQSVDEEASLASTFFESLIHEEGGLPSDWTDVRRDAALTLASIRLNYADTELGKTELLLKSALNTSPPPSSAWRSAASALLILTVARQQGRDQEALELARELGSASTEQLLDLFQQIASVVASANSAARPTLAALQLEIGASLTEKLGELSPSQQRVVQSELASALETAGQTEAALAAYAKLAKEHPTDGAIQEAYASSLLNSTDQRTLKLALDQWRRVASKSRPRSDRWFKAKYSIALSQFKAGDKPAAAKLIRYLQATEDLSESEWQPKFDELLARCSP